MVLEKFIIVIRENISESKSENFKDSTVEERLCTIITIRIVSPKANVVSLKWIVQQEYLLCCVSWKLYWNVFLRSDIGCLA